MRPRFRLRTLLVLTALAAAACYWWVARPTILANRFIHDVNDGGDFQAADRLFLPGQKNVSFRFDRWRRALVSIGPFYDPRDVKVRAYVAPRSWSDLVRGQRRVHFDAATPRSLRSSWLYIATPRGIREPPPNPVLLPADVPFFVPRSPTDDF